MGTEPNVYSPKWFEFFHTDTEEARTNQEALFVATCAPLPEFRKILDVCCGLGRHARALSALGYSVIGVDRDADIIAQARKRCGGPDYVIADIRDYKPDPGAFDVVVVMSQSFGYFDAEVNRDVLRRFANSLRKGGHVILDLWNPDFFAAHQSERDLKTPRGIVRENKSIKGDRLFVDLKYPGGQREQFEWQLFTPAQMTELARSVGLALLVSCTDFDIKMVPSPAHPRIQFVLERKL